ENGHPARHQLEGIKVASDDHGFDASLVCLFGECPEHIVGLVSIHLINRNVQRLGNLANPLELSRERSRSRRPCCLIVCELLMAKGRRWPVHRHYDMRWS